MRNLNIFIIALACLGALLLLAGDNSGGFIPHFGRFLAGAALLAGNLISTPLTFLDYRKHRSSTWLLVALCVQVPIALGTVYWLIGFYFGWHT